MKTFIRLNFCEYCILQESMLVGSALDNEDLITFEQVHEYWNKYIKNPYVDKHEARRVITDYMCQEGMVMDLLKEEEGDEREVVTVDTNTDLDKLNIEEQLSLLGDVWALDPKEFKIFYNSDTKEYEVGVKEVEEDMATLNESKGLTDKYLYNKHLKPILVIGACIFIHTFLFFLYYEVFFN